MMRRLQETDEDGSGYSMSDDGAGPNVGSELQATSDVRRPEGPYRVFFVQRAPGFGKKKNAIVVFRCTGWLPWGHGVCRGGGRAEEEVLLGGQPGRLDGWE